MTPGQTGGTKYDARIRRAELLAGRLPSEREFLEFYKHVASFQKALWTVITNSIEGRLSSTPSLAVRGELDLTLLLPQFRGYLSIIEQHAPPALEDSARQMAMLPSESCATLAIVTEPSVFVAVVVVTA